MLPTKSQKQKDLAQLPEKSINNNSKELSKNMLGVLIQFTNLATQFELLGVSRKYREVIKKSQLFMHFNQKTIESKRFTKAEDMFKNKPYITTLKKELESIYTTPQVQDFLIQIIRLALNKVNGELNLGQYVYIDEILEELLEALRHNKTITTLDLSCKTSFGENPKKMELLREALKHNKTITTLDLGNNGFGKNHKSMEIFKEVLIENTTITALNLNRNWDLAKDIECMKAFVEGLKQNKTIKTLGLQGNSLAMFSDSMELLIEGLKHNKTITKLNLKDNYLGISSKGLKNIMKIGFYNSRVYGYSRAYGYSFDVLVESLKHNNNALTELDLSSNELGENFDRMELLREALKHNKTIKTLGLGHNDIGLETKSMEALVEGLKHNNTITTLCLTNNRLERTTKCMQLLREALKHNKTITTLDLACNDLGKNYKSIMALAEGLKNNKTITTIDLRFNCLSNTNGMKALVEGLKHSNTITKIDLTANNLDENFENDLRKLLINVEIISGRYNY